MFESPSTPEGEHETTSVVIPNNATMQTIENVLEDVPGRVNIIGNVMMYREMPECVTKAAISTIWGRIYGNFLYQNNMFATGGTAGTKYSSGNLLSPHLSVWDLSDENRHHTPAAAQHLMQPGPAPNWVLEFEWYSEINKPRKGVLKVQDGFFNEVGVNQTRVNEAWVMVKHQDVPVHNAPPRPSYTIRLLRSLSYLPVIGLVFFIFLRILDLATGTQWWTGRTRRRDTAPADPAVPYIIVYFRQNNPQRHGYYWLHWHEDFVAPEGSLYHTAPPTSVNPLLDMMRAQA